MKTLKESKQEVVTGHGIEAMRAAILAQDSRTLYLQEKVAQLPTSKK